MEKIYRPIFGLSKNIIIGLPISVEALFMGISSIFRSHLIDKKGWKPSLFGKFIR
jgi:hypothetical protein